MAIDYNGINMYILLLFPVISIISASVFTGAYFELEGEQNKKKFKVYFILLWIFAALTLLLSYNFLTKKVLLFVYRPLILIIKFLLLNCLWLLYIKCYLLIDGLDKEFRDKNSERITAMKNLCLLNFFISFFLFMNIAGEAYDKGFNNIRVF